MENDRLGSSTTDAAPKHVIFVEDDKNLGFLIRKRFEQAGLKCSVAENGVMAQRHVVNNHIDLVITDYHMPIMDGVAFIQWMHRNRYQVPIILLSGDMHEDLQAKIGPARIFAILKKPCSFSELYVKVLEVFHEPQFSSN